MNEYELIFILRPNITDQEVGTIRNDIKARIQAHGGNVVKEHNWGKRQLGFPVNDYTEGNYTYYDVSLPADQAAKFSEQMRIDERVMRFMFTRADKHGVAVKTPKKSAKTTSAEV